MQVLEILLSFLCKQPEILTHSTEFPKNFNLQNQFRQERRKKSEEGEEGQVFDKNCVGFDMTNKKTALHYLQNMHKFQKN